MSYSPETPNSSPNRRFSTRVTLQYDGWPQKEKKKNNRAPPLYYTKLCASFRSQSVNLNWSYSSEALNSGQIGDFRPVWLRNLTADLEKTIGHISHAKSSLVHHFITIREFELETDRLSLDLCDLGLWPLTFCTDVTFANCNQSWQFHDDTMRRTLSKRWDGRTDDFYFSIPWLNRFIH